MSVRAPLSDLERTRRAQRDAADPRSSAWVSANAGTGKTHVLTLRALRLMLAGTIPERILCLTYTKAAAAEMSKRVYDTLARWVTMDDAPLAARADRAGRCGTEPGGDRARAHALHDGDRDAGRLEGADDPLVLRAAPAALSPRGGRGAGLRHPRRGDCASPRARGDRPGAGARGRAIPHRPRGARCKRRSAMRPTSASTISCAQPCASAAGSRRRCASILAPTSRRRWRGSIAARSACATDASEESLTRELASLVATPSSCACATR